MNNYARICIAALLCLSATSLSCIPMPGQRLLTFKIELDGSVVYEGIRGVPDHTPVVAMWDVLGDVPFESTDDESSVLEDDEKNVRALEGAIVVRIKHVNNELAHAPLKKLTLRSDNARASWSLDDAEVKRIKAVGEYPLDECELCCFDIFPKARFCYRSPVYCF